MLKSCIEYLKEDVLVNDEIVCCLIHTDLKKDKSIKKILNKYFNANYDIIDILDKNQNQITKENFKIIENKILQINCFAVKILSLIENKTYGEEITEEIDRMIGTCQNLNESVDAIKQLI